MPLTFMQNETLRPEKLAKKLVRSTCSKPNNNIELKEKQISNFRENSDHLSIKLMTQEITTTKINTNHGILQRKKWLSSHLK